VSPAATERPPRVLPLVLLALGLGIGTSACDVPQATGEWREHQVDTLPAAPAPPPAHADTAPAVPCHRARWCGSAY
jgi:hypothetical protein